MNERILVFTPKEYNVFDTFIRGHPQVEKIILCDETGHYLVFLKEEKDDKHRKRKVEKEADSRTAVA